MDQLLVRAVAHKTVPFSQHKGGGFPCSRSSYNLQIVPTLTDMVDPDAPCPTRHALDASVNPASAPSRRRRLRPGKFGNRNRRPITNGNAPAARRRRTIRAIARSQPPSSRRGHASLLPRPFIPTEPASELQTYLPPVAGHGSPPRLQMELRTCAAPSSASLSSGRGAVPSSRLLSRQVSLLCSRSSVFGCTRPPQCHLLARLFWRHNVNHADLEPIGILHCLLHLIKPCC
jgi:hypothetical protein